MRSCVMPTPDITLSFVLRDDSAKHYFHESFAAHPSGVVFIHVFNFMFRFVQQKLAAFSSAILCFTRERDPLHIMRNMLYWKYKCGRNWRSQRPGSEIKQSKALTSDFLWDDSSVVLSHGSLKSHRQEQRLADYSSIIICIGRYAAGNADSQEANRSLTWRSSLRSWKIIHVR